MAEITLTILIIIAFIYIGAFILVAHDNRRNKRKDYKKPKGYQIFFTRIPVLYFWKPDGNSSYRFIFDWAVGFGFITIRKWHTLTDAEKKELG